MKRSRSVFVVLAFLCFGASGGWAQATRDDNLAMGNPSAGRVGVPEDEEFLIIRPQYALSYNAKKGTANWVSWHLSAAWKGDYKRKDVFRQDPELPRHWYRVKKQDYSHSGFDRGHLCPSDDRDADKSDNEATFYMTNIVPQSPVCNQQTWHALERYCTQLVLEGYEMYIIAGTYGRKGQGNNGNATSIATGRVTVPRYLWKVILILPEGTDDVRRVNPYTRVIAVKMPNRKNVNRRPWWEYKVTVDALERLTGYDFFSNVDDDVEEVIEARLDGDYPDCPDCPIGNSHNWSER